MQELSLVGVYLPQANAFKYSRSVHFSPGLQQHRGKRAKPSRSNIEDNIRDLECDSQAKQYETELQELHEGIIAEVPEKQPICYERFNLRELSQRNKLKKFNIYMLVRIVNILD